MRSETTYRLPDDINPAWRFGIVHASFYSDEVEAMVADAEQTLHAAGIPGGNITRHPSPGSFEIPLIGRALAEAKAVDALLAFGIIVQGETQHADLLAAETARGIMDVQLRYGIPFTFEVLYVRDLQQARDRTDPMAKEKRQRTPH
jgi:6,7-dimethyl-8-ribityllumazine synthase